MYDVHLGLIGKHVGPSGFPISLISYNHCIECHSRTVILCRQNTENIHQINNERKPSRASIAVLHFHKGRTDKTDLNDRCQTFVSSRLKERSNRAVMNTEQSTYNSAPLCNIVCGLFTVQCITVNSYGEQSFALLNFREPFVTQSLG